MSDNNNDDLKDGQYLRGYIDALSKFSKDLDDYKENAFESDAFTNEEVDGVTRMEHDLQRLLSDYIDELDRVLNEEGD